MKKGAANPGWVSWLEARILRLRGFNIGEVVRKFQVFVTLWVRYMTSFSSQMASLNYTHRDMTWHHGELMHLTSDDLGRPKVTDLHVGVSR